MSGRDNIGKLGVYVYGASGGAILPVIQACLEIVKRDYRLELDIKKSDIAIAPLFTSFLTMDEINIPRYGTLVFHPSLLPRHRGADAIKWAFKLGEAFTGVTWFWPDEGIDTGDICEQEVIAIIQGETPREFYMRAVIPAAVRTVMRALEGIAAGRPRRIPQQLEHGTYEPKIVR